MKKMLFLPIILIVGCAILEADRVEVCENGCQGCSSVFTGDIEEYMILEDGRPINVLLCGCKKLDNSTRTIELHGKKNTDEAGSGVELWQTVSCNAD